MMPVKFTVLILLLTFIVSESSIIDSLLGHKKINYRLPNNTAPRLYVINLELYIDDAEFTFNGTSSTVFEVLYPTKDIVIHASKQIEIDKTYTRVIDSNGRIIEDNSQNWDATLEFFNIQLNDTLPTGNYSIELKWKGHNAPTGLGFHRQNYTTTAQAKKEIIEYLVVTEFQATGARFVFPCWDEPSMKAEFDISIKHHTDYTAISNMPVESIDKVENQNVWTHFERSPLMSTYFVALVVAIYRPYINEYGNITMWVSESQFENAQLAFNTSLKVIPVMERYTGIPYALEKMDQAIVPYYASEAIEHWGLITYGPHILWKPGSDDIYQYDGAAGLVAHEIAHQWFGNLVTPAWWNDLWLSESLATYFQHKILDEIFIDWNAVSILDTQTRNQYSFRSGEEGETVYPIRWMPESPDEIDLIFGGATYIKGSAVVEMLEHILTEEIFQNGIRKYLSRHQYSTVVADDFWHALQEAYSESGLSPQLNIKEMMEPWIEQTGYPLVNVTRDYTTGLANITQMNVRHAEPMNSWMIPINYATSSHPNFTSTRPTHWIPRSSESLIITGIDKFDWVILNIQNKGFYRVNYDWENWKRLSNYLNSEQYHKIHIINRSQLLYDIIYLSKKEDHYLELMMDMLSYLHREKNYLPWTALYQMYQGNNIYYLNEPQYQVISKWMLHLMDNIINQTDFNDNMEKDHLSSRASIELTGLACRFGHKECRARATAKLTELLNNTSTQSNQILICSGLMEANETLWDVMMNAHYANSKDNSGYEYLGCTSNQTLIKKYLQLALDKNETFLQNDIFLTIRSFTTYKQENMDLILDFVIENYEKLQQYDEIREEENPGNNIVQSLATGITNESQCDKFTKFINNQMKKGRMEGYGEKTIKIAKENTARSEKWSSFINSYLIKKGFNVNSADKRP